MRSRALPQARFVTARLVGVLLATTTLPAVAQWPAHGTVYERTVRERWRNEHQSPAFTRWGKSSEVIRVDSLHGESSGTTVFLAVGDPRMASRKRARVVLESNGRIVSLTGSRDPSPRRPNSILYDSLGVERIGVTLEGVTTLPTAVAWDVIASFHPAQLVAGARWSDTVRWTSEAAGVRQEVTGVRTSRLLRDSVIDGRHYWLVRDTMRGSWSERVPRFDITLQREAVIERSTRGTVIGSYLIDATTRTVLSRDDTLHFTGTAVCTPGDGTRLTSPTTFEQVRHLASFDSTAYVALVAQRRAAAPRSSMFRFPEGSVQEALAAGKRPVRDSLLRELVTSRDVDQRWAITQLMYMWRGSDNRGDRDEIRTAHLQAGDTAAAVGEIVNSGGTPINDHWLAILLPFLVDANKAFAWGLDAEQLRLTIEERLVNALPAITPDSLRWPCTRSACTTLARLRTSGKDAGARQLGLIAAFALDPKPWADALRSESTPSTIRYLVNGVGAVWLAGTHPPMPPAGATASQWTEWMTGKSLEGDSSVAAPGAVPSLRYSDGHDRAMRMTQLLTGRTLLHEWQQQLDRATTPLERYTFEYLLAVNHAWHPTADSIAAWLEGESKLDRARGNLGAGQLDLAPADSATVTELVDRVLAHAIDGEAPWPSLYPSQAPRPVGALLDNATRPGRGLAAQAPQTIYVKTPVVTAALRAKWGNRVTWVTDLSWELAKEQYPAAVITIRQVERTGHFASIGEDIFSARKDTKGVDAGAGGNGYLLLLTKEGWKIVSMSMWVV